MAWSPPPVVRGSPVSGDLPGVEQQARIHFNENLARDRSQQLHGLLETGFLAFSTCAASVCAVPNILKMAN
jgi:hypothetical protein